MFDIFNLNYLLNGDNITKLTMDFQKTVSGTTYREIQYSIINKEGVLASFDTYIEQAAEGEPVLSEAWQSLQVYSAQELKKMLVSSGFSILQQINVDGSKFNETKSERVLTVAKANAKFFGVKA